MRCKWYEEIWFYNDDNLEDTRYEWFEGDIIDYVGVGKEVHAVIRYDDKLFNIDISSLVIL